MKRIYLFLATLLVIPMISFSCAASRNHNSSQYEFSNENQTAKESRIKKEKLELDECEEAALNSPTNETRAYASAIDDERQFAREEAILLAEAALVERIEAMVGYVTERYQQKGRVGATKLNEKKMVKDIKSQSQRVLENSKIVCSNLYQLSNGDYEYHICISVPAAVTETVIQTVFINESERTGTKYNKEQFKESYREAQKRLKEEQDRLKEDR